MGRAAVRAAIVKYLKGAQVEFLGTVNGHPPKLTPEGDFVKGADPGTSSGAVVFLHLIEHYEHRLSGGPPASSAHPTTPAKKMRTYNCGLICVFRSKKPDTQAVGADNDTFLDSLAAAIEADRKCGTGSPTPTDGNPPGDGSGVIFQWGEGDQGSGSHDLITRAGMPKTIRQEVSQVFSTMDVTVLEVVDT